MKMRIFLFLSMTLFFACTDFSRGEYINQVTSGERFAYIATDADTNTEYRLLFLTNNHISATQSINDRSSYVFNEFTYVQWGTVGEIRNMASTYFTFEMNSDRLKLTTTPIGQNAKFNFPTDWILVQ